MIADLEVLVPALKLPRRSWEKEVFLITSLQSGLCLF